MLINSINKIILINCKMSSNIMISSIFPKTSSFIELKIPVIITRKIMSANKSAVHCSYNNTASFEAYMVKKGVSVNKLLEEAITVEEPVKQLHESMKYSLLASDKRVRAAICIAACELVGGNEATALPVACAVEMIHTASSILADLPCVYNNNGMRWGKATNHEIYGEDLAILAGHALLALAMEHLVSGCIKLGVPSERIVKAVAEIAKCMGSEGLAYDSFVMYEKPRDSSSRVKGDVNVNFHKPEALLEGSLVLGAIVGGAEDHEISKFRDYAKCIAPSFDNVDHILGISKYLTTKEISMEDAEKTCVDAKNHLATAFADPDKAAPLIALAECITYYDV